MLDLKYKILIALGAFGLIAALSFIIYKQIENNNRQIAIEAQNIQQKQLIDGIVRSSNSYASKKDIEDFAKTNDLNLKAITADLDKLHASVSAINFTTAKSSGQTSSNIPSTSSVIVPSTNIPITVPCDGKQIECPDPYGYLHHKETLSLHEHFDTFDVPFGSVDFVASSKTPWSVNILPREYKSSVVIAQQDDGRIITYNKLTIKAGEQTFTPSIISTTEVQYPESHMSWINPRIFMQAGGGLNSDRTAFLDFGLSLGLSSYGQTRITPDISFLQFGVMYQTNVNKIAFSVAPISYNISKLFPNGLVHTTFVGPSLNMSTSGVASISLNLSVGL